MAHNSKKDHAEDYDLNQIKGKTMIDFENNCDDDQDTYISERSSVASSGDINQASISIVKAIPAPTPFSPFLMPQTKPHTLRCHDIRFPKSELPLTTKLQLPRKIDKRKNETLHKVQLGHGALAPLSETKSSDLVDNRHPYYYYYKMKNAARTTRHHQTTDGPIMPYKSFTPSQCANKLALTTSSIKPKQQLQQSRQDDVSTIQLDCGKPFHDHSKQSLSTLSWCLTVGESHENNHQQKTSLPMTNKSLENFDNLEHREKSQKRRILRQGRNMQMENDVTNHCVQSFASKSFQNSDSLMITSNSFANQQKTGSKISDKKSLNSDISESSKRGHRKTHRHYPNQIQLHNSPSIPSQQNHHHHHHHHHHHQYHVRRRPPSDSYVSSEFQIVNVSVRSSERLSSFEQVRESFHSPLLSTSSQNSCLPSITRDYHYHQKSNITRFPTEYYGTLARGAHSRNSEESIGKTPKVHGPEPPTRFYDRHLNNVVDKRLAV